MPKNTMIIIDGNSLAYRAFHAIPPLSTSRGLVTNAVYGFTNMLLRIIAEEDPGMIAVAFDKGKITFRHDEFEDYKAHRSATPEDLRPQFPVLKDVLRAMRIQIFEADGFEADDLIGALSARAELAGIKSVIVTGDRDALQLVSPLTRVRLTKKGISELDEYNEKKVLDRYGITPGQYTDFRGLTGDSSDNIPGIPGIGEKTATRLLKKYGSLEEVLAHAGELRGRMGEQVQSHKSQAEMSKRLSTINREAPLDLEPGQCRWQGPDYQELLVIFNKLEFKKLIKSIFRDENRPGNRTVKTAQRALPEPALETYPVTYRHLDTPASLKKFQKTALESGRLSLAVSGNEWGEIIAAGIASEKKNTYLINFRPPEGIGQNDAGDENWEQALETLKTICEDPGIKIYCHDAKNLNHCLRRYGINLKRLAFDTMIASYLLNPASSNQEIEDVSLEYLSAVLPGGEDELPAKAHCIFQLAGILEEKLKLFELDPLYYDVELPLTQVLAGMEMEGVAVDKNRLETMSKELGRLIKGLEVEIYLLAGRKFNINSPKQLGVVLFEDLKLPVIKRTKTGYSTDAGVLDELAVSHEIVAKVLEYRQLMKLKSTYTDGLAALVDPGTGRLHTTLHQTVTATGRLSSCLAIRFGW